MEKNTVTSNFVKLDRFNGTEKEAIQIEAGKGIIAQSAAAAKLERELIASDIPFVTWEDGDTTLLDPCAQEGVIQINNETHEWTIIADKEKNPKLRGIEGGKGISQCIDIYAMVFVHCLDCDTFKETEEGARCTIE